MDLINQVSCLIGKKEAARFRKELVKHNEFHRGENHKYNYMWSEIIKPSLFDHKKGVYIGIQHDKFAKGRNHYDAESIFDDCSNLPVIEFFTNPLAIDRSDIYLPSGARVWEPAKHRVVLGRHQIFTFEYDDPSIEFFREQVSWVLSPAGKPLQSKIGEIYRECSEWKDFAGITMNYSGAKSFHIHIVFETSLAAAIGITDHVRVGHEASWHRLRSIVDHVLKTDVPVDESLRFPDQLRRLPGGTRELEKPNLLGIPKGEYVPQLILWEKYGGRAANGAKNSFFQPTDFTDIVTKPRSIYSDIVHNHPSGTQMPITPDHRTVEVNESAMAFLSAKMREHFPANSFPAYKRLAFLPDGTLGAYFKNSRTDNTASSVMRENYATVLIQGSNPGNIHSNDKALPAPFGDMIQLWLEEFSGAPRLSQSQLERDFADKACDKDSARQAMRDTLKTVVRNEEVKFNLVCAPEGISKTTSLFRDHPKNDRWLSQYGDGKVMYAFLSYDIAEEKCREFNDVNGNSGFCGVVLHSLDRAYSGICKELDIEELKLADLSRENFPSKWAGIEKTQPQILDVLKERHSALWAEIGDRKPVFFTVHAVAQRWYASGTTRVMWAPSFWKKQSCDTRMQECRAETALSLLVHDELKASDLIAAYPKRKIDKAECLFNSQSWKNSKTTVQKHSCYQKFFRFDKDEVPSFYDVLDMEALIKLDYEDVITSNSGEYAIRDLGFYAKRMQQSWLIATRSWPSLCADRTLCLTTESVPTEVAQKAGIWNIMRLDTPSLARDQVMVQCNRSLVSEKMADVVQKERDKFDKGHFQQSIIVSNKAGNLTNAYTHERAKGSNQFIGKNIIQTMSFKSADEFEWLEALNAWTGSTTLVRQSHIDQFNQTAGRNLNFRKQGDPHHLLIVHTGLWLRLQGSVQAYCRYAMMYIVTKHDCRKASIIQKAA